MRKSKQTFISNVIRFTCLSGAFFLYSAGVSAADLPTNGSIISGSGSIGVPSDRVMNVSGLDNTIIKWGSFDIGMQNTVNFTGKDGASFNVLNYVSGGAMSSIYGTLNGKGGNVYLVNPAGVFIGGSASIDVGSLYVSNRRIEALENGSSVGNADIASLVSGATPASGAELMSLGYISANKITFDGDRVVLNTERLIDADRETGNEMRKLGAENINVITNDREQVLLGFDAYDEQNGYALSDELASLELANVRVRDAAGNAGASEVVTGKDGYMWIYTLTQLQAMNSNLSGKYALLGGIDATITEEEGKSFQAIGDEANPFTGVLDGLRNPAEEGADFAIFDLHIQANGDKNVGLFGVTDGARISNLLLSYGVVEGGENVGAVVGYAKNTELSNVRNSVDVSGAQNVGGLVGKAENSAFYSLQNSGSVYGTQSDSANIGGIVGAMYDSSLSDAYNYGKLTGALVNTAGNDQSHNVGGIIGFYSNADANATLTQLHNEMEVVGGYNVGGVIGGAEGVLSLSSASNNTKVTAQGYTDDAYTYEGQKGTTLSVNAANAGGIIGSVNGGGVLSELENTGNVQSVILDGKNFYLAGNVGGIIGKAQGASDNALYLNDLNNLENTVYGAHNVGGVVGSLENTHITLAINSGEVMGTGARLANTLQAATEQVSGEKFIIGNIGGIAGYAHGKGWSINQGGNFGDVHTLTIGSVVTEASQAANVGGILGHGSYANAEGKISIDELRNVAEDGALNGVISNSYNAGDVRGYTGVGGIAGLMHNGGIVHSYNVGTVNTTRLNEDNRGGSALNLGGILGDSTVGTQATTQLYDVYNTGVLGDANFVYGQRHIGGIVGRNSGEIEKSYNMGAIYNNSPVNGGIVGSFISGSIKNSFNTGDIVTKDVDAGGIVGSINIGNTALIENVYNLGSITGKSYVGGLVGTIGNWNNNSDDSDKNTSIVIRNAYTLGNVKATETGYQEDTTISYGTGKIYGGLRQSPSLNESRHVQISDVYYILPEADSGYAEASDGGLNGLAVTLNLDAAMQGDSYAASEGNSGFSFVGENGELNDGVWRIYEGVTLPILNAFLPTLANDKNKDSMSGFVEAGRYNPDGSVITAGEGDSTVRYGSEFNPMQTVISYGKGENNEFVLNWAQAELKKNESIAVNNGALTINDFNTQGNYYGGMLVASGALTLNNDASEARQDILLGSMAHLQGASITLNAGEDITVFGTLTADGDLTLNAQDGMSIMGKLYAGQGADGGDITLNASEGGVTTNLGVKENGLLAANGALKVNAGDSVYIDSDLQLTGDITLKAANEIVLDASNVGRLNNDTIGGVSAFLEKYSTTNSITMENAPIKLLTLDFWDAEKQEYDFGKYGAGALALLSKQGDSSSANGLDSLYAWVASAEQLAAIGKTENATGFNYAVKNDIDASVIEDYSVIGTADSAYTGTFNGRDKKIVGLDVSRDGEVAGLFGYNGGTIENVQLISGNFEGAIVGGIAGVNLGEGTISNITTFGNRVATQGYVDMNRGSGEERYVAAAGGVAGLNDGVLNGLNLNDNVLANAEGSTAYDSYAGGAVGINGFNGNAQNAIVANALVNSAVTGNQEHASAMGGVAGFNAGSVLDVESMGIVNGSYEHTLAAANVGGIVGLNKGEINGAYNLAYVDGTANVGGIVGTSLGGVITNIANGGIVNSESIGDTQGMNVGGIAGRVENTVITQGRNSGDITGVVNVGGMFGSVDSDSQMLNIVNDGFVNIVGESNVGGVVGYNEGIINAEQMGLTNNGVIYGNEYVGGVAGYNVGTIIKTGSNVTLNTTGEDARYFGGVVGFNAGKIEDASNTGRIMAADASYVGGIVGYNEGEIKGASNANSGVVVGGQYVGGVVGYNKGKIDGINNTSGVTVIENDGLVIATQGGAGGIFGVNDVAEIRNVMLVNNGIVLGNSQVGNGEQGSGGIASVNNAVITDSTVAGRVDALVADNANVGGLFGVNNGSLIGGRDEQTDAYYKYVVFNNGAVVAAELKNIEDYVTWRREDVAQDVFAQMTLASNANVGGLVGVNGENGVIRAAYNTGSIFGGTNVGGIAGTNKGVISEVFNNVAAVDERTFDGKATSLTEGRVVGLENVGGVVGMNYGTVDYAYNLTGVESVFGSSAVVGNLVAVNSGSVQHSYALNLDGSLIGTGAAASDSYTFAENDSSAEYIAEDKRLAADSYKNLTLGSERAIWRFYDGYNTPLLKVFLTKVDLNAAEVPEMSEADFKNNYLDAHTPVDRLIDDQLLVTEHPRDFASYDANKELINMDIVSSEVSSVDADNSVSYLLKLWSKQNAISGVNGEGELNPNLLGYDLQDVGLTVIMPENIPENPPIPPAVDQPSEETKPSVPDRSEADRWMNENAPEEIHESRSAGKQRERRERKAELRFVDGGMELPKE